MNYVFPGIPRQSADTLLIDFMTPQKVMRESLLPQGWSWDVIAEEYTLGDMHEDRQQSQGQASISVFQQVK